MKKWHAEHPRVPNAELPPEQLAERRRRARESARERYVPMADRSPEERRSAREAHLRPAREWARRNAAPRTEWAPEKLELARGRDRARYTGDRREQNIASARRHRLKTYGITPEQYDALVAEQGDRCACCGGKSPGGRRKYWCVDHDHETKRIRGLLCQPCNTGIGMLGDDVAGVRRAVNYLEAAHGVC
jgi:Recombination endonuclease VII